MLTTTKKVCVGGIWRFRGQQGDVDTRQRMGGYGDVQTLKLQKWKAQTVAVGPEAV